MERPGRPAHVSPLFWQAGDSFAPGPLRAFLDTQFFSVVNGWTLVHALTGALLGPQLFWHSAWEFYQVMIGMTNLRDPDKWLDIAVDTAAFMAGAKLVERLGSR